MRFPLLSFQVLLGHVFKGHAGLAPFGIPLLLGQLRSRFRLVLIVLAFLDSFVLRASVPEYPASAFPVKRLAGFGTCLAFNRLIEVLSIEYLGATLDFLFTVRTLFFSCCTSYLYTWLSF